MTSAEELELTHAALRSYVAELQARKVTYHSVEAGLAVGQIAEEIEARFLTEDAWQRSLAEPRKITREQLAEELAQPSVASFPSVWSGEPAEEAPPVAEPVAAFGERE